MNEKVYELLDTLQKTAVQAGAIAADAAYGVSRKTEELLSTAKQRSRLAGDGLLEEIAALREELGCGPEAPVCPVCGNEGEDGDQFCRDCGGKL